MLDISALSQLQDLKKNIQNSIKRGKGVVKGTSKRFGFVTSDTDHQQYLLPQTEMDKVLPGDTIEYILEKGESGEDKYIARVEKLVKTEFSAFIGAVKIKKEQMYILPDHQQFNRWIFIPPKFRKGLKEGDLVAAKISLHPFANGRVQAEVTAFIGQPDDPFIEHRYAIVKQGIEEKIWHADELQAIRQTAEGILDESVPLRQDLRAELFFTIDGASTQDLDDALAITKTDTGWALRVAIADVSAYIDPQSPLDKIAARQACSIYLPGQKVPMLPDVLSSDVCSLKANKDRLVIVCDLGIKANGEIATISYSEAVINSKGKLSYDDVSNAIQGKPCYLNDAIREKVLYLNDLANARNNWRSKNALLMDEFSDYRFILNEKGKITAIERLERNAAHHLVEECMIACNEATARFISEKQSFGLFLNHNGFKSDQISGVEKLLDAYFPDFDKSLANTLDGYKNLFSLIDNMNSELALKEILRKKLVKSEWSTKVNPHFGLGIPSYTTFTSPIRKYSDLLVHRIIKNIINDQQTDELSDSSLNHLNEALQNVRNAQRDCDLSLKCQYVSQFKGKTFEGEISMINHKMVGVYIPDFDIHGQIEVRSLNTAFTFKQDSLQLLSEKYNFKLKQSVSVTIDNVDENQRQVKLSLAEKNVTAAA